MKTFKFLNEKIWEFYSELEAVKTVWLYCRDSNNPKSYLLFCHGEVLEYVFWGLEWYDLPIIAGENIVNELLENSSEKILGMSKKGLVCLAEKLGKSIVLHGRGDYSFRETCSPILKNESHRKKNSGNYTIDDFLIIYPNNFGEEQKKMLKINNFTYGGR